MDGDSKLEYLRENPKQARGYKYLRAHLEGKAITLKQALLAHCFECNGFDADGRADCEMPTCPLYPSNPNGAAWKNRVKKTAPHLAGKPSGKDVPTQP